MPNEQDEEISLPEQTIEEPTQETEARNKFIQKKILRKNNNGGSLESRE